MKRRVPPAAPDDPPSRLMKYSPHEWVHLVTEDPPPEFFVRYEHTTGTRHSLPEEVALWRGLQGFYLYREARAAWAEEHGWPEGRLRELVECAQQGHEVRRKVWAAQEQHEEESHG